ncbi:YeeE/YedE thiosulfate transporter family protein [Paraburkholderia terrae]|uniref:YeeE/YedE thiosulfate transporter family protein n=1 Tax=Paraburkholderia terrae TaxID=311230 RepID=UPI00296B3A93|nr:YeeE/YedE thiosulfate transporter family protein [Paraburkholderia terrae]MDW3659088.1 YeeE/YedE thiosulfate transporter family protein [Paraburkholderia terrae]
MIDVTPRAVTGTLAALCALAMGVAIRRGATCTVAAVNEIIDERRCGRLLALIAASTLVLGGLLLAHSFDVLPSLPASAPVTRATVWGGLMLGLGASVNGACALGTIARIGAGQWCYVATPIGYYAGCHVAARALAVEPPLPVHDSQALHASASIAVLLVAIVATFAAGALHSRFARTTYGVSGSNPQEDRHASWSPHVATGAIGITFVLLFVLDGAWTYTDTLADLAQGHAGATASRALLFGALLLGATSAAVTRAMRGGHAWATRVTASQLARCLSGGALMGWASLMIPGGNDSLVLVAMPLLRPYAWVAFAAMSFAIGAVSLSRRLLRAHRQRETRGLA